MRTLAAAFLAAFLAAGAAAADECAACKPGKICPTHESGDDAAAKEAGPLLKDRDLEKRRSGIDRLAEAAAKHLNARSKKLTNELVKMLQDPEATVKSYAAERLGDCGDEAMAAQVLAAEVGKLEKALAMDKPSKEAELRKWEEQLRVIGSFYAGLGKLPTQAGAAAAFDRGIRSANPWVGKTAAESCRGFKKNKLVVKALVDMLAAYFAKVVTDGNSAAWMAISMALPEVTGCNDIPSQRDTDAARWNAAWQKWWRENEKTMK